MSNQGFQIHIKRQPQLPVVLAFPLLLVICGVGVSVFNFLSSNATEIVCLFLVPLVV